MSGPQALPEEERFWPKVDKSGPLVVGHPELGPCWLWTAHKNQYGYGSFSIPASANGKGRSVDTGAHCWSYVHTYGAIPEDMTVDHVCHSLDVTCFAGVNCHHRACVNPSHLEAVPGPDNTRRAGHSRKTHCPQGHPYNDANTHIRLSGHRSCRVCDKESQRQARAEGRAYVRPSTGNPVGRPPQATSLLRLEQRLADQEFTADLLEGL